jgi:hypothetical protein
MALGLVVACRHDGLPPEITIEQVDGLDPAAPARGGRTPAGVTRLAQTNERSVGGPLVPW